MPSVPYLFNDVPRVTRQQLALEQSLLRASQRHAAALASLRGQLETLLQSHLHMPCTLQRVTMTWVPTSQLPEILPETSCVARLGVGGRSEKVLLETASALAFAAVCRLLGTAQEPESPYRGLTELESGVFGFLVLQILAAVNALLKPDLQLSLDDLVAERSKALQPFSEGGSIYLISLALAAGEQHSYARILIPASLVQAAFAGSSPSSQPLPLDRLLALLGDYPVTARLVAAQLDLTPADLQGVEVGDIIVLEEHKLSLADEGLAGEAQLLVGAGQYARISGQLRAHPTLPQASHFQVTAIHTAIEPEAIDMTDSDAAAGENNNAQPQAEGILRDVAPPVVVELARLRMNMAQLLRLDAGEVEKLPRSPRDPLDIVVGGRLFARGELLEVDGELGIRLTQIFEAQAPAPTPPALPDATP